MTYKSKVLEFHGQRLKLSISSYRRDLREVSDVFLCKQKPHNRLMQLHSILCTLLHVYQYVIQYDVNQFVKLNPSTMRYFF